MSTDISVLSADEMARALTRISHEIAERNTGNRFALVGIHRRGVPLATRLQGLLRELRGIDVPLGDLDISFHRCDREQYPAPIVHGTRLPFNINEHTIVLVDDVLFTGRTARAAIDALFDLGRPPVIQFAAMVDRGHRELPIRPDFVGKNVPTALDQRICVLLAEMDESDGVQLKLLEAQR